MAREAGLSSAHYPVEAPAVRDTFELVLPGHGVPRAVRLMLEGPSVKPGTSDGKPQSCRNLVDHASLKPLPLLRRPLGCHEAAATGPRPMRAGPRGWHARRARSRAGSAPHRPPEIPAGAHKRHRHRQHQAHIFT